MFRELTEKEQRFYDECKIRGLEPFYDKMVQHSLTKEWTNYANKFSTNNSISKILNMKEFKTEIISLLEQYSQALPVTEFTDDEQWYLAVEIGATDSALIAAQSLIQDNLEEFRLGDISPYSYKGDMGSPMLLYKAKNNQGFGLLNSYLVAGAARDIEPNPSVKELLRLTGRLRRSQAHEPSPKKLDFYINVTIPAETLMLENLALAGTEINYVDEEYDGVYYFKNSEIGADWQDVPESIYLMYALGKNPSPQFYKLNSRSLNYPGGL